MAIECPTCGYEHNPPDAEFCETCGADLGNTSTSMPSVSPSATPSSTSQPIITPPAQPFSNFAPPQMPTPPTMGGPSTPTMNPPTSQPPLSPPASGIPPTMGATGTARLIALSNAPVAEFKIYGSAVIGIFEPGNPIDIDLEIFPGSDKISRHHAEIIYQNGVWIIKDSSTNGTYIKPLGESQFGARIMSPTPINSGDTIAFANLVFRFESP